MFGDLDVSPVGIPTNNKIYDRITKGNDDYDSDIVSVFHMGDMAYELEGNNGTKGDDYFRAIEKWAARIPYMYTPGNHEAAHNFSA